MSKLFAKSEIDPGILTQYLFKKKRKLLLQYHGPKHPFPSDEELLTMMNQSFNCLDMLSAQVVITVRGHSPPSQHPFMTATWVPCRGGADSSRRSGRRRPSQQLEVDMRSWAEKDGDSATQTIFAQSL